MWSLNQMMQMWQISAWGHIFILFCSAHFFLAETYSVALARRIKYLSLCESCSICMCDRGCYWIMCRKKKKKKLRVGRLIRFYSFSWENLISLLISLTQDSTGVIFASKEQQYLFYVLWRRRPLEGPLTLNCLYQTHISCLPVQIAKNAWRNTIYCPL